MSTTETPRERSLLQWAPAVASIVRQPILDEFGLRHGYELLFKGASPDDCGGGPAERLSFLDSIVLSGLDRLTAGSPVFLPCTHEVLTEDFVELLPAPLTVLEISSSVAGSPGIAGVCQRLRNAGFRFALLDLPKSPAPNPLLDFVQYIKLDSTSVEAGCVPLMRQRLNGTKAAMVATGVHSQSAYWKARAEGFKFFQGYYFCIPERMQNARIPADRLVHVEILRELLKEPLQLNTLCPLVKRDAALVYRVLRQVNSPAYAIRTPVNSIELAMLVLGDTTFRRIATLAIGCALNAGRPPEILHTALVRARFCAETAILANLDADDQYLLGLLSVLPGMLGVPMELVAPELPLRETIGKALLGIPVHERCLLDWIECHETGNTPRCRAIAIHYGLNEAKLMQAYIGALAPDRAYLTLVA